MNTLVMLSHEVTKTVKYLFMLAAAVVIGFGVYSTNKAAFDIQINNLRKDVIVFLQTPEERVEVHKLTQKVAYLQAENAALRETLDNALISEPTLSEFIKNRYNSVYYKVGQFFGKVAHNTKEAYENVKEGFRKEVPDPSE